MAASVRCAESPARLSGRVTKYDTLYRALVDRESLQPIAISTIDAQETPSSPEGVWRVSEGRRLGDRSHSPSVDFSLTNCTAVLASPLFRPTTWGVARCSKSRGRETNAGGRCLRRDLGFSRRSRVQLSTLNMIEARAEGCGQGARGEPKR